MTLRRALALAAVSLAASACCGAGKLDDTKLESSITTELAGKGVVMKSIDCPSGRPQKAGDKFDCSGVDEDGEKLVFHVEQTDGHGGFSWKMDGMIINKKKVGDAIEAKLHKSADVQCSEKAVILNVGQSFTCDAIVEGKTHKVQLTLTDASGNVSWKLLN
jgi:hypothetical protein